MDGTQFLVQWDEHPSHLATRLGYLLEHQSLVDVTLMCNTHTLKVHRAVLAACSPYFERQLGNHPLIVLKDMQFSVLKSLVEFMYCGETSVSEENLTPLLEAAKFFEVKGLSSMTKETVCTPTSPTTNTGIKPFNGTPMPTTSGYSRGSGRGRGRGRGRPPLNPTSKIGSPTESAQILLSLSGNTPSPQLYTTSKNVKIDPAAVTSSADSKGLKGLEPRRRGRKRGALNTAFRDRMLQSGDTRLAIESLKRDLSDDADSPLLSSLLSKSDKSKQDDTEYLRQLKDIGLPTDVPILIDNGDGKLVSLTEDVLKTAVDSDGNIQLKIAESSSVNKKRPVRPFVAKEIRAVKSDDEEEGTRMIGIKSEMEEPINDELIENLKTRGLRDAELEPDAVVLFEVTDDKRVEKFVLSAKDVSMLKSLNEQLANQKKELSDITRNNVSTVDVVGTNTKIAELKLKIGKTKSVLSQFVHLKEKLKNFSSNGSEEATQKRVIPEMLHLEFVDGNGEKIGGYDLRGTVEDKRGIPKDHMSKEGDFLGLFDMVCSDGTNEQSNPMLSGNPIKKPEEEMLTNDTDGKEMSYQLVLDDHNENISYDQIEAMMSDSAGNIVIEEKTPDLKYIIDNEGNIMNQDENYVVYESENVIYDNTESILPDVSEGENSNTYVVPERVIPNEGTEYIVEYNDKGDLHEEMKELNDRSQYIVYHDSSKENYEEEGDTNYDSSHNDHNFDSTQEDHTFESNHADHNFDNSHSANTFESNLEVVKDSECNNRNFVIYPDDNSNLQDGGEERLKSSPQKDVPFAVGLVPLKDALEKFQTLSEHQPRKTRSNSMNGETLGARRRSSASSESSEPSEKRRKVEPTSPDEPL